MRWKEGLLFVAGVSIAVAADAQIAYFGPQQATVGMQRSIPVPGTPYPEPLQFSAITQPAKGITSYACVFLLDTYGPSPGDGFAEASTQLIYSSLYNAWRQRTGLNIAWAQDSVSTCATLLSPGTCVNVSGHVLAAPDVLGRTYIVDQIAYCP